mmetsp:Transcript_6003/g.15946  ORF Transcript_6003/g.15946 Transcript_6003/m.15946 type:complete len:210 (-) Transcript_6003:656-1285(-)|eukprot:CAMPEP_0185832120 /NCGR_PEP_ID=MMETSP1353-20130828/1899_1 /TAXON_ID=1077150 /ORGANISM="Erythrolobus australicus, Strain CCMP3124" /LENGTH=209 /DNA_ID=CAMNT_0028530261 /DNA_START=136 /DNA_END=765 /DNA_ORIENTATION=+
MAFVSGFCGARVAAPSRAAACAVSMSAAREEPEAVSRRQLLAGAVAGVAAAGVAAVALPQSAAAGGEGPKLSIFGGGSQSSPFVYGMKSGGPAVYKPLNAEDVAFHKKICDEGRARLDKTEEYIARKSWDEVRAELRRQLQNLRHSQERLMEAQGDKDLSEQAAKYYKAFKSSVEDLDYAAREKKVENARKARTATLKAFDSWYSAVGL